MWQSALSRLQSHDLVQGLIMPSSSRYDPPDLDEIEWPKLGRHRPGRRLALEFAIPIGPGNKETIRISATQAGARFLKEDLSFFARECGGSHPLAIKASLLWRFLSEWEEAATTNLQRRKEDLKEILIEYGPWIRAFAERVSQPPRHVKREDRKLLNRILVAAQRAGYDRAEFCSQKTKTRDQLLRWPIQAYLIEFCSGGAEWWTAWVRQTPFDKVRDELARSRRSDEAKRGMNLYRLYLGPQWETLMTGSPDSIPPPVRRLQSS